MFLDSGSAVTMALAVQKFSFPGSGVSSGGAVSAALRLSAEVENATIVCIVCDRGDRYLSTGASSQLVCGPQPAALAPHNFWGMHQIAHTS